MQIIKAGPGRTIPAGSGVQRGPWLSFDIGDGLPSSSIVAIAQDRRGDLWFGTTYGGGACRFDGMELTLFSPADGLPGTWVNAIVEDGEGYLWFGTRGGVGRYDGDEWVVYTAADGLAGNSVTAIALGREGYLWFGTEGGVSRFDGGQFTSYTPADGLPENEVVCIVEDQKGHLWFGTWGGGACCFDGAHFSTYTPADGLAYEVVSALCEDGEGRLWLGTGGHSIGNVGLNCYVDGEFATYTTADGLAGNNVGAIYEDEEGDLWFGTYGGGVSRYAGERFTSFTVDDGLADNTVTEIAADNEGNLWFGTGSRNVAGGGVSRYAGLQFDVFTTADGLVSDNVGSMCEDRRGHVWFGTWKGVSRYDGERFTTFLEGEEYNVFSAIEDRRGDLWFGLLQGRSVYRYGGGQFFCYGSAEGLVDGRVYTVVEDGEGTIWVGTTAGVCRYDGSRFMAFTAIDKLVGARVQAICADRQGRIWFGTNDSVYRYDGEGYAVFTADDGLISGNVSCILEDREGHMWFGTSDSGVSRYDGVRFVAFTAVDGLAHNEVSAMVEDGEGRLWISTYGGGVSQYDGLVFQNLHRRNPLPHGGVKQVLQDRLGDYWIATDGGGVVRYRPTRTPPGVRITNAVADREYGDVDRIDLQVSQRLITFEFAGRSFKTDREQLAYAYRLEAWDEAWQSTRQRRVSYQNLELGEYVFQVRAVDRDLNYSEPATMRVNVVADPRVEAWKEALSGSGTAEEFVGESAALRQSQARLAEVAPTDLTVLIQGETGTGKGLAARAVHGMSPRAGGPFIAINCGAIPAGLVESELFGHERGAFTGAVQRKIGKVELAQGGTLFLDEIGDMAQEAQVKVLRLIEEKVFERVGGAESLAADVRMVAATNRRLERMVEEGQFREDLYFRLQPFPVQLPPLRQRREDIALLAAFFAERMSAHLHKEVVELAPEAVVALRSYDWPGNVRELEHVVQQAVIVCRGPVIGAGDIALGSGPGREVEAGKMTPEEYERQYIREALEQTDWVIKGPKGAAQRLGMSASTLRYRMKKLGIRRD